MKCLVRCLALFLLPYTAALAQMPAGAIKHIIVVIQENRTPDNLFGADTPLISAGANLWRVVNSPPTAILCHVEPNGGYTTVPPTAQPLDACFDPQHGHTMAFVPTYDGGANDGLCNVAPTTAGCNPVPASTVTYSWVPNTLQTLTNYGIVQPYYDIAANYGFANYMFQTNQGPSYPAHQFLFSGTSAPDFYNDPLGMTTCGSSFPCWEWFAAENPNIGSGPSRLSGCATSDAGNQEYVYALDPNSDPESKEYTPPIAGAYPGYPCFNHPSILDVLPQAATWKYYAGYTSPADSNIWTAPNSLYNVCQPSGVGPNATCTAPNYYTNVFAPTLSGDQAQILTDIEDTSCTKLKAVSWVTPDGRWSDDPGCSTQGCNSNNESGEDGGPSWLAWIVNAVGNNTTCNYWSNTAILVTWDDWGGFYDHVNPAGSNNGPGTGYFGQSGAAAGQQYVYGFRVPLLVVSAYTPAGYISGANTTAPSCPGPTCHDFGSILGFIEHVSGVTPGGIGPLQYRYADFYAPDGKNDCPTCSFPLADFFSLSTPRTFTPINSWKYAETCFHMPNTSSCFGANSVPQDPDNDGIDEEH